MLKKIAIGIGLVLVTAIIGVFLFAKDIEIKIPEQMAQAAINQQISEGPIKHLGVEIALQSAKIDFRDDNTTVIEAVFSSNAYGYRGEVNGTFKSGLRYLAPRIYLHEIDPINLKISSDEDTKKELNELKTTARKFLERQKQNAKSEKNKATIDRIIGQSDEGFQDNIREATYIFFEGVPIYDLNTAGTKGSLASLALKNVRFTDSQAIITLSPVQALIRILTIIGFGLLAVLYFTAQYMPKYILDKLFSKNRYPDS